jgi:23S rRNA (guanosine2251-2'-O)-methyltransferase
LTPLRSGINGSFQSFKLDGYRVLGTSCHSEKDDKLQVAKKVDCPTLLLIGSEGSGLSESLLKECDENVFIEPMQPLPTGFDSLNAAVATAILVDRLRSR